MATVIIKQRIINVQINVIIFQAQLKSSKWFSYNNNIHCTKIEFTNVS